MIKQVSSFKYLEVMTACRGLLLNLFEEIQHIYFLWRLRSFGASRQIILVFLVFLCQWRRVSCCTAALLGWVQQPICETWTKLYSHIQICAKIIGQPVAHNFQEAHNKSTLRLANSTISSDLSHVLNGEYQLVKSLLLNTTGWSIPCCKWDLNLTDVMSRTLYICLNCCLGASAGVSSVYCMFNLCVVCVMECKVVSYWLSYRIIYNP